jgi:hypothetical protein
VLCFDSDAAPQIARGAGSAKPFRYKSIERHNLKFGCRLHQISTRQPRSLASALNSARCAVWLGHSVDAHFVGCSTSTILWNKIVPTIGSEGPSRSRQACSRQACPDQPRAEAQIRATLSKQKAPLVQSPAPNLQHYFGTLIFIARRQRKGSV